ncbi:MAG: CDP-alcohol phosphatidyltransferase [Spirochaetes bacterium ADurb.Bin218]|jgi:CDP-diacylglycerol--serine O-phosphatidyltransferase|nr:CDP-alcohol phosphatidyltransferase family protein [Spirochaetota bacterium]OQB00398.1 MAG: CDP-alcohol phosphatidyltransferase [Spirochaetes bacterium ADurb.Bin218]HOQ10769.1 CDP-alcohol phosphatidyltransferase family protein [Spirochaetota bacterium]HOV08302.1 CDP-alcohol phosphatidyltransferase family protein [Spirochaetota bacterium]
MGKKKSIIPNIFTMGNMVMGFFSILVASQFDSTLGNYEALFIAGVLIFVGSIFDASDGAIARALNVESEIGMQLDSLADAVSYGIAPGFVAYKAFFYQMPEIYGYFNSGMIIAAIFPICAVYRLARFNCTESIPGFIGLPSPPAGIVAGTVPAILQSPIPFTRTYVDINWQLYLPFFVIIALLMVSNVDYNKLFSDIWKKGKIARIVAFIAVIMLLVFFNVWAIFCVTLLYVIWGLLIYIYKAVTRTQKESN